MITQSRKIQKNHEKSGKWEKFKENPKIASDIDLKHIDQFRWSHLKTQLCVCPFINYGGIICLKNRSQFINQIRYLHTHMYVQYIKDNLQKHSFEYSRVPNSTWF